MKKKLIVGALVPEIKLGNPDYNADIIIQKLVEANDKGVEVVATPELSLTGSTVRRFVLSRFANSKDRRGYIKDLWGN